MQALLCLLLAAACVCADESETRRSKLPYIADAVGNTLPPPSNGPATVGSPVNLLTPDRYEFYTFDESGELVKRLMTLEEIQAIVAAGEENDGLVTFANENQPTIAFNFSQPPYTKVHSVVTNVQNVLKAQMEAHKNRPYTQPTLDTPDVSDSWSLILPSIFGNTGVDIVPDKTSATFTTPETETIELDDNSLSKEGLSQIPSSSSTKVNIELKEVSPTTKMPVFPTSERLKTSPTTAITSTTTTPKPTSPIPLSKTTTAKPTTTKASTTSKPTTIKLRTTSSAPTNFTNRPKTTTTSKPRTTTTTIKPTTKIVRTTPKPATAKPITTTKKTSTTQKETELNFTKIQTFNNVASETNRNSTVQYEKISTFVPLSTAAYVTERATQKPDYTTKSPATTTKRYLPSSTKASLSSTKASSSSTKLSSRSTEATPSSTKATPSSTTVTPTSTKVTPSSTKATPSSTKATPSFSKSTPTPTKIQSSTKPQLSSTKAPSTTVRFRPPITTYKPALSTTAFVSSTPKDVVEKFNLTTITTQSVSPSTTASSTEYISLGHQRPTERNPAQKPNPGNSNNIKGAEPEVNFFDVAQSFSQIASDLGGNYQTLPTTSDLLETTKLNDMNLESKENLEIEIPADVEKPVEIKESTKIEGQWEMTEKYTSNPKTSSEKPITNDNILETKTTTPKLNASLKPETNPNNAPKLAETTKPTSKPILTDEPTKENESKPNNNPIFDNFVKISTLEPHENRLSTKEFTTTFESKNTEATTLKSELTTSSTEINTAIDPVLSESMDDLFSQIVNQVPQAIFEAQNTNQDQKENSKISVKKEAQQKTEIASEASDVNKDISGSENITNDIPQIVPEIKTSEQQNERVDSTKISEQNKTINISIQQNAVKDKENLVKIPEITKNNEKNEDSSSPSTTLKEYLNETKDKGNQVINKSQTVEKDKNQDEKNEEVTKVMTTTEGSKQSESTKITSTNMKEPNIAMHNANKISSSELNKISNTKDNEKILEEPQKMDEFKKKIQKVNIDDKELANDRNNSWKLISTVSPPKSNDIPKDKLKTDSQENIDKDIVLDFSKENQGLEVTTKGLGEDIAQFTELCNELAFRYWQTMTESIDKRRSFILSPYSITSMLAMMFMGARGATSGEMNEILKLDDMVTFNPHFTLKNISDSIVTSSGSGVIESAFIRELFSDRSKGKILTFYKERAHHFYNGHVEEINFKLISDIIRRRTNLLVKRYTWGRITEYMKSNTVTMQPPLAAFSANIFQTDCTGSSVEGRDGEMYFVVSPNVRQRRLVPVPAVVYRSGFLAGYDPALDATAAALGNTNSIISTLFLMPGQQGNVVHAEDLEELEKRLLDSNPTTPAWNRLLRTLLPRMGLELQIPRFLHKSIFNVSTTLQKMGLKELFDPEHADLGGLIGPSKDLYLSDMVQSTTFVTCGEGVIGEQHHIEEYPESLNGPQRRRTSRWATGWDEPRDYQRAFHDPHDVGEAMNLPLHLRPRQARLPSRNAQPARLKFDRPFLYFVRHNPTGMILYVGRYNPRLLP